MIKRCLIIDNDNQSAEIENLIRLGKARGITIECEQFNVGNTANTELLTSGHIDIDKVIAFYKANFRSKTFHLAAFDWNLSDPAIDGVELIRKFESVKILRNTPKLLYSGALKNEISSKLITYKKNQLTINALILWLSALIRIDIKNFVDRVNYEQEILTLLSKTDETLDLIIEEEMNKFPKLKFNSSFTSDGFKGKSFLEISAILEDQDVLRNNFKKEIVQHVIAYLTEKI